MDILIHEENLKKSVSDLQARGFNLDGEYFRNIFMSSLSGVEFELHFSLETKIENLDKVLF